ncbi:Trigalactosyldiacylglycerol 1 isoform 2 [Hibiscus syriacus]|uniref:Trigalactosyldiacylglycerol 1 isoform 2 n=1 Tax=Hibiscus syriacus TaxID=106335 RepID=A0A6A3BTW2_HIBSY|nr:Trigalactosyldiacylglycerol 1 isoform 2 [Hibiscus syriacus]
MANKGEGSVSAVRDPEGFLTYKAGVDGGGRLGRIAVASDRNHTIMFGGQGHVSRHDDHDLAQHVNVFNQIVSDLAWLDVKIEDEDKAMIMLCSLPPSYEHMGKALKLIAYMSRIIETMDGSQKRQGMGNGISDPNLGIRRQFTVTSARSEGDMLLISTNQLTDAWILDSGCSYHITPNRKWFSTYRLLGSTVVGGVHSVESCDDTIKLWHMRLAHLSESGMVELHKRNLLHDVKNCKLDFCKYCVLGKQNKVRFKNGKHTTDVILDYSENGTEYTDSQFLNFCKEHGINRHLTVRLPKHLWVEAVNMACYLINRSPRESLAGKVTEENKDTTIVDFEQFPVEKIETSQPTSGGSATVDLQDYSLARDRWMAAMVEEMESLNNNRTWEDRDSRKLWLSQWGYVEKMLEMFAMSSAKPVSTLLLMLLVKFVSTCLNLVSNIGKQPSGSLGYVDSDYAGDLDNRRSTTRHIFTLGGGPICWKSTVQSIVALSTIEAEYMAAAEAAKEALWLTGLVKELGVHQGGVQLLCDNQSTIHLAKNHKVHTDENAADMFTKPVTTDKFMHCMDLLNVSSLSVDGDIQGVERLYGAPSAHMWPGMVLKSGDKITEPTLPEKEDSSEEEPDYQFEYEVLSAGSAEPRDDMFDEWVSASAANTFLDTGKSVGEAMSVTECVQGNITRCEMESHAASPMVSTSGEKIDRMEPNAREPDRASSSELDDGPHYDFEDLEQLMSQIGNIRSNLRLIPDFQRREMAAKLAFKMAALFGGGSDNEEEI